MDSIKSLLSSHNLEEPEEIQVIKEFVRETFQGNVGVNLGQTTIVITTPSAGLAGTLRPHLHTLKKLCNTDKKLIIRIG